MTVFTIEMYISWVLWAILVAFKAFALGDAIWRKAAAYEAADKQSKTFWLIILVLTLGLAAVFRYNPLSILNLIADVALFVYLADVRPAMRELRRA